MDVAPSCDPQRVGEGYIATPPGGGIHTITISASLTQDLVGLTELAVLSLQGLELGGHVRGQAKLAPAVSLGPANPLMQRLRSATDLARNRDQRCPTRRMFMLVIQTIRTARARTSGENLFVVLLVMAPPSLELEPPANQGRFTSHSKMKFRWNGNSTR